MSWSMSDFTVALTVRAFVSQASDSMVVRLRPFTPAMAPCTSRDGRAGRNSRTPGLEEISISIMIPGIALQVSVQKMPWFPLCEEQRLSK